MAEPIGVRVEGVRELTAMLALLKPGLERELGQRNKAIGTAVIAAAFPKPTSVGAGSGATPRPSASRNILQIMAGGSWRKHHVQQWGHQVIPRENARPYILGAGLKMMPEIERQYVKALVDAAHRVGLQAEEGL
jgi:hypothetical protein